MVVGLRRLLAERFIVTGPKAVLTFFLKKLQKTARTSRIILKRHGENGKPHLVPDFRGIVMSFSPFNLMLAVGLLYIAFIMLRKVSISFRVLNFVE
ncbi:hypothetical protein H671_6g15330 [Cricetulus griseus]|nr:hypothetical protein H671_6g15330 [Cricetulus griseus]